MSRDIAQMRSDMSQMSLEGGQQRQHRVDDLAPRHIEHARTASRHTTEVRDQQEDISQVKTGAEEREVRDNGRGKLSTTRFSPEPRGVQSEQPPAPKTWSQTLFGPLAGAVSSSRAAEREHQEHQRAAVVKLPDDPEELKHMIRDYEQQLHNLFDDNVELHQRVQDAEQQINRDKADFEAHISRLNCEAWEVINAKGRDLSQAQAQQQDTEETCRRYEKKMNELEQTVRRLQASALQTMESGRWAPLPDADIKHKLKEIASGIYEWSSDTFDYPLEKMLVTERFDNWAKKLKHFGCLQSSTSLRRSLCNNSIMANDGKAHALLVTAHLTTSAFRCIIGDPFFAFTDREALMSTANGKCLQEFVTSVKTLDEASEKGAEDLRCRLLRLVHPVMAGEGCELVAQKWSAALIRRPDEDVVANFATELTEAVELAWALWTRKARIEVLDFPTLFEQLGTEQGSFYSAKSEWYEAHSYHSRELAKDPNALEGREIILLCCPAVVMAGNMDGEDYHKRKILKKAVVWMG